MSKEDKNLEKNLEQIGKMAGKPYNEMTGAEQLMAINNWIVYKSNTEKKSLIYRVTQNLAFIFFGCGALFGVLWLIKLILKLVGVL